MGPSIAEGSQGWRPNWADLPVAARRRPKRGIILWFESRIKIWCNSQEFELNRNQAIDKINPISPMRLYKMAWRAAVLASARPYHHPINKKDIIPTPSHPINN